VLSIIALAHCSHPSSRSPAGATASGAAASAGTIRIGIDLPVSGADASIGIPTQNGAILAIEQANARHALGPFTIVPVTLDDAVQGVHDPAQGVQNVKTFIADEAVLGIVGPYNSNVAQAQIPVTNDAGIVQISPATTSPLLTEGDAGASLRSAHPNTIAFFRVCTTDDRQGGAAAELVHKLGFRSAFVVDDNETYGTSLSGVFERRFAALGGRVLGHEHLTRGQQDFKALLTKIHGFNPDIVFFGGTTSSGGGLLRRQMGDVGMNNVPFVGGDGIADEEFVTTAGPMANDTYFTVAAPDVATDPRAKDFRAAYEARWKAPAGPYSANAYTATDVLIAAIGKAIGAANGKLPTREAVRSFVAATRGFASPIGVIGFDRNGDITENTLSLYQIRDGKTLLVSQVTTKS
jgi:branched-chain amino acid transport system substrate-binding protein